MTVTKIQKFIWNDVEPLNYDRSLEKWNRTQTIEPLLEVNNGAFIASKKNLQRQVGLYWLRSILISVEK